MKLSNKTLLMIIGSIAAALLQLISRILQNAVIDLSGQNMFGFERLIYVVAPAFFLILGAVQSSILNTLRSLRAALLASLIISSVVSMVYIKEAFSIYFGLENFHETYFKSDIFQICSNFIIFPLVGLLIWNVKKHFDENNKFDG